MVLAFLIKRGLLFIIVSKSEKEKTKHAPDNI